MNTITKNDYFMEGTGDIRTKIGFTKKDLMSRVSILLLVLMFAALMPLQAQHPNVMISQSNNPNEPAICLDPKNPDRMVAGANIENFYLSTDGGQNWSEGILTSDYGVWGDPCIIVDTAGAFYFFHLSNPASGNWIDRIVCQKITDFAGSWSPGTYTFLDPDKQQDKEWAVVNRASNEIYVTWTQFDDYGSTSSADSSIILFAKSADGGLTWTNVTRLSRQAGNCIDSDLTVEGAVPAVGPGGEIVVSWAFNDSIWFDRSTDGGATWLYDDIFVTDQPGGWDFDIPGISRCNGFPVTCCDLSGGPCHGHLYINFSDQRNGTGDTDVWLVKSTDGGNSWSQPLRVNDDPPGKHQFFTWMTIDQVTGYLYFVFYDRRNYANNATDVYMAVSKDGGATFTNFKVSQSSFIPSSSIFFGDYNNVTAHNNVVRPVWTRMSQGDRSIWTALVDLSLVGMEEEVVNLAAGEVYPNPATGVAFFSYKITRPKKVRISMIDILGEEIAVLADVPLKPAGKYVERIDTRSLNLRPGVYMIRLEAGGSTAKKQLVVVD